MFNKYLALIIVAMLTFSGAISSVYASDYTSKQSSENNKLQKLVEIENPVIFQLSLGAKATGSRMTIHNNSEQDLIIEGVHSDLFKMSMLHSTKYESGKRIMFEIDKITIPAHKKLALTPNTHHLMMFHPLRKLELNEFLTLTVKTNQGEFKIIAKVVEKQLR